MPLAPFLSGGIDSYAVVDSMTRTLGRGVSACTIGFDDPEFDERAGARESAAACGAKLHEEVLRGSASAVATRLEEKEPRGEFVVAVHVAEEAEALVGDALLQAVRQLRDQGLAAREITARLRPRGAHRRDVYAALRALDGDADPQSSPDEDEPGPAD